jgi:hypothetical protein
MVHRLLIKSSSKPRNIQSFPWLPARNPEQVLAQVIDTGNLVEHSFHRGYPFRDPIRVASGQELDEKARIHFEFETSVHDRLGSGVIHEEVDLLDGQRLRGSLISPKSRIPQREIFCRVGKSAKPVKDETLRFCRSGILPRLSSLKRATSRIWWER